MFETILLTLVAWMCLATSAFRFRRELGITAPMTIRALRIVAAAVLVVALGRCGAPVTGERIVRFLGAGSISAVVMVVTLSVAPGVVLRPVTLVLAAVQALRQPRAPRRTVDA